MRLRAPVRVHQRSGPVHPPGMQGGNSMTWAPELLARAYYSDDSVVLIHGDCLEVLADVADASVTAVLTDPPYTERTHGMAKTNKGRGHGVRAVTFDSMTEADLAAILTECGRVSAGWVVATLSYQHAFAYDENPPAGLRCLRLGVWVKTNPMPQISADRPGQGWESIAYMHRADVKPAWNGGGKAGNYVLPVQQGEGHPTVKPLSMLSDWVRLFTNPGDVVLDPFAGSGTTLVAAIAEGRRAIGVEREERYCELIAKRLAQGILDFTEAKA